MTLYLCRRKAYMTLLETLIAMTLLSVLLTFVFGFFRELSGLTVLSEKAQKESFHMRYVESRLGFVFERIVNEKETSRKFFFFTQPPHHDFSHSPSLILTFNNEIRLDAAYSGDVLGRLYVNLNHHFCLAVWPLFVSEPHQFVQEEILLRDVVSVSYSFYSPPEKIRSEQDIVNQDDIDPEKKKPKKDTWHDNEWAITYEQMPVIVKMMVKVAKNPNDLKQGESNDQIETNLLTFFFVLPSSKNPIQYPPVNQ